MENVQSDVIENPQEEVAPILTVVNKTDEDAGKKNFDLEAFKAKFDELEAKHKKEMDDFVSKKFLIGDREKIDRKESTKLTQNLLDFVQTARWNNLEALSIIKTSDTLNDTLKELKEGTAESLFLTPESLDLIMRLFNRHSDTGIGNAIKFSKLIYCIDEALKEAAPIKFQLQVLEKEKEEAQQAFWAQYTRYQEESLEKKEEIKDELQQP
jgi:hypothetical protein